VALKKAGAARVVNVSSFGHQMAPFDFEDPHFHRRAYETLQGYGQSKTANNLFTVELDTRAKEFGVRAYSVHPGSVIGTDLGREAPIELFKQIGTHDADGNIFFGFQVTGANPLVRRRRRVVSSEQWPNPDSRVTLSEERDALGMPKVRLDWRLNALDRHTMSRTAEILHEDLRRSGVVEASALLFDGACDEGPRWNWHHIGTTRMHEDPRRGVVDADCRVHGVGNLYIAGSSVFPTAGNHTPTLTIIALALRTADHLRRLLAVPAGTAPVRCPAGLMGGDVGREAAQAARIPVSALSHAKPSSASA
jgi:choline dehydrogenase-like flavoprotein